MSCRWNAINELMASMGNRVNKLTGNGSEYTDVIDSQLINPRDNPRKDINSYIRISLHLSNLNAYPMKNPNNI